MNERKPKKIYKFKIVKEGKTRNKVLTKCETIDECKSWIHNKFIDMMIKQREHSYNTLHGYFDVEVEETPTQTIYRLQALEYSISQGWSEDQKVYTHYVIKPMDWEIEY